MKFLLTVMMAAVFFAASLLINGYLFMTYWSWFIAPPFGVGLLSFAQSVGIIFFIKSFVLVRTDQKEYKEDEIIEQTVKTFIKDIIYDAIVFCVAFSIKYFIS